MGEFIYKTKIIQKILEERRKRRIEFMLSKVNVYPGMRILDIGCGPDGRSLENYLPPDYRIVGIDLYEEREVRVSHPCFSYIQQDATDLSRFIDKQFDLTFSIGMMEHICNQSSLKKMIREIERVSKQYIIIVPWRWAWIEPHFKFPFFQLFPYTLKVYLTRLLNLHSLREKIKMDFSYINKNYQWFSSKVWNEYFLGSTIYLCPTLETIAIVKNDMAGSSPKA